MARYRQRGTAEVEIQVPEKIAKLYVDIFRKHGLVERADDVETSFKRFGATEVDLSLAALPLEVLEEMIPATGSYSTVANLLKGFVRIMKNPKTKVGDLRLLPDALAKYLATDVIDGWLYKSAESGERVAYLVEAVEFHEGERGNTKARVEMTLKANRASVKSERSSGRADLHTKTVTWHADDVVSKNIADLILEAGLLKETKELKAEYEKYFEVFAKYRPRRCEQFLATGTAMEVAENYYSRQNQINYTDAQKVVNDEDLANRAITTRADNKFWREYVKGLDENGVFSEVPVHPYLLMFDLKLHTNCWVHVGNLRPYIYDGSVKDKLILPQDHRDLIDILTTDINVFTEDIVKGKSGGIGILCYGKPGLGKTLTAEVYSELIKKPLYRVDAGQLGTTPEEVQKALEEILKRAERWQAILLIDEADVYIRKRGDDIKQNAIVATFLTTLEYFNGLMFMTTNRAEDVDDAIVSRMVAVFKYETPTPEMRPKLWEVLAKQFECIFENGSIHDAVEAFPEASGRDIKQLLRLTKKYCTQKKVPLGVEALRICAMFRGLK